MGSDTPQTNVLRGLKPRLTKSCGVSDPAEQSPAGYQTSRNNIQKRIFLRFRKRNLKILGCELGTIWGRFVGKTRGKKSRATVPLTNTFEGRPQKSGHHYGTPPKGSIQTSLYAVI